MIGYLKGTVEDVSEDMLLIDVGGVGFEVKISSGTASDLPAVGEETRIYTYMSVKEDDMSLFGFLSKDDLDFFKLLITVSGIGPKGAQQILSAMNTDDLRFAILSDDAKAIAKAPGIGLKTAQKAILELKDKINVGERFNTDNSGTASAASAAVMNDARTEAVEALVALGYSSTDAYKAVKKADISDSDDANAILKAALRHIGG